MNADGQFAVVVWNSLGSSGTDTDLTSIQGRRYGSDGSPAGGSPAGGEFQINTYTTYTQAAPSISMDANGGFAVVWQSFGSSGTDTSSYSIQKSDAEPVLLLFKDGFETGDFSAWSGNSP